jgi:hypothetical protein
VGNCGSLGNSYLAILPFSQSLKITSYTKKATNTAFYKKKATHTVKKKRREATAISSFDCYTE